MAMLKRESRPRWGAEATTKVRPMRQLPVAAQVREVDIQLGPRPHRATVPIATLGVWECGRHCDPHRIRYPRPSSLDRSVSPQQRISAELV